MDNGNYAEKVIQNLEEIEVLEMTVVQFDPPYPLIKVRREKCMDHDFTCLMIKPLYPERIQNGWNLFL
jgi:hypothetical protein